MDMEKSTGAAAVTESRDLRTGTTVWSSYPAPAVRTTRLHAATKVDAVVVGAGITGALVAHALINRGHSTLILDRRPPAQGSTAASTALLQFEIDTPLIRLANMIGQERARSAWLASYSAVNDLAHLIREQHILCDFHRRRSLYLPGNVLGPQELAREAKERHAIGLPSMLLTSPQLRELSGIERPAAVLSTGVAEVNPVRLTLGLLQRSAEQGCTIHSPVELADVVPSRRRVELLTSDGFEIEAKSLVFATGYELAHGVSSKGHKRTSTWAFATRPQAGSIWGHGELIWEAAEPYLYIRTTTDGRVVVGGEDADLDDEAERDRLIPAKIAALERKTKALLPSLDVSADYAWAGTFGESETGLPTIGAVPGMPNCYAVLGYGGNGITFAMLAAQIISDLVSGTRSPEAELFEFRS
jgi:glycine/D-amino acid oxidase-like deaminating enzyme